MCYSDVIMLGSLTSQEISKVPKDPFFQKKVGVFIGIKSSLVLSRRQSEIGLDRRRSGQS